MTDWVSLGILSSGSAVCAAWFHKKYEEILPLSVMGIVLLMYLFGIVGALEAGFYAVLICAVIMYLLTVVRLVIKRDIKAFCHNFITPGAIVFLCAFWLLTSWNFEKLAMSWDEFSHWVDVAKVMTTINDFSTSPLSHSAFQSYPPAMALFQYFLQKLNILLCPEESFVEWRVYLAYQVFFFSLLMPIFRDKTFKSPVVLLCTMVVVFASPLLFYSNIYASVYIDAFLGVLSGVGLATVFFNKEKDFFYSLYIWMICAVLVLAKDAGMVFAVFLAGAYVIDLLFWKPEIRNGTLLKAVMIGISAIAVWFPKKLWTREIAISGAAVNFSAEVDAESVLLLLQGKDETYRSTVIDNFRNALFEMTMPLGNTGISVNYVVVLLSELLLLYLVYKAYAAKNPTKSKSKAMVMGIAVVQLVAYTMGLSITYAFKFSEYEAVRLASFSRYIHIGFLAGWIFIMYGLLFVTTEYIQGNRMLEVVTLYGLLVISPIKPIVDLAHGVEVKQSIEVREPYEELTEKVMKLTQGDDSVYLISQGSTGLDYWVMRFNIRPNTMNGNSSWSIGEPFFEGDIWTKTTSAQAWQALLVAEYDYVALYKINDYFIEHFAELFEDPESIANNMVYKVNKQTGMLALCE